MREVFELLLTFTSENATPVLEFVEELLMFRKSSFNIAEAILSALDKSLAIIEFDMEGNILRANENFLSVICYSDGELRGKHHRIFLDEKYANSVEYREFWAKLRNGEFFADEFLRFGRDGKKVWLEATYNPIIGADGKPFKVVKLAADITQKKEEASRLVTMIENMPIAVMTADPANEFKINYMNATSQRTLGPLEKHLPVPAKNLVGQSIPSYSSGIGVRCVLG